MRTVSSAWEVWSLWSEESSFPRRIACGVYLNIRCLPHNSFLEFRTASAGVDDEGLSSMGPVSARPHACEKRLEKRTQQISLRMSRLVLARATRLTHNTASFHFNNPTSLQRLNPGGDDFLRGETVGARAVYLFG